MLMRLVFKGAGTKPIDHYTWPKWSGSPLLQQRVTRTGIAGAVGHGAILVTLCGWAAVTQYRNGSLAGPFAYLFLASCVVTFGMLIPLTRPAHLVSLRGVVEMWFLLDYVVYGTLLCSGVPPKIPLPVTADDAYSQSYLTGTLALISWGIGARLGIGAAARDLVPTRLSEAWERPRVKILAFVFTLAFLMSIYGLAVLVSDAGIRQAILFRQFGLTPPPGMGRYSSLFFILPSTGVALVYLATLLLSTRSRAVRVTAVVLCGLLSAVHMIQGRRLMCVLTLLMAGYLLRKSGALRLRLWYAVPALLFLVPASLYFEQNKNAGWMTAQSVSTRDLFDTDRLAQTFQNSVGRFDITAAVMASRPQYGYYHGQTFLDSFLHALPTSLVPDRPLGIGQEIGELIYNNFGIRLVTQAGSLVAELDANFGFAGILCGFLLLGWLAARMDAAAEVAGPLGAVGYALVLFRFPHHLVVASYAGTPLTLWALAPFLAAVILIGLTARRPGQEGGYV